MKIINFIMFTIIFCGILLTGCLDSKDYDVHISKTYPIIDSLESVDGNRDFRYIRLYVIDSCEYIGHVNAFQSDFLTHKGNCKYCIERNKTPHK